MRGRRAGIVVLAIVALAAVGFAVYSQYSRGDEVLYQDATSPGPDPFGPPAIVTTAGTGTLEPLQAGETPGAARGPFGGTGELGRCDKAKLADYLAANPDRRAAWAGVLGIDSSEVAVRSYIDGLVPTILTRDVRITNHGFKSGKAYALQSILQKGTAVLVEPGTGKIVVRCFCGNPLLPPKRVVGHCTGCPPQYTPPPSTCGPNECVQTPTPTPVRATPIPTPSTPSPTPFQPNGVPALVRQPTPSPTPQKTPVPTRTPLPTLPPRPTPAPDPTPCGGNFPPCDGGKP